MAKRHHTARSGKQKQKNKGLLISIALFLVAMFAIGLYFLMQKAPAPVVVEKVAETPKPKSVLPSRPEEVWSYIQALETRTIPVDDKTASSDKSLGLTEEQRKILQAMAEEQKQAEQAAKQSSAAQAVVSTRALAPAPTETKESKAVVKNTPKPVESKGKKYGLQCGAFKNQTQAESLKSRLSALGLNVKVNSNSDWHRVVVGPVGDRASTLKVQERAKSITNCVVIGM
ncbi:cell division protein FtsN [[Haemophilus] felis]|nr:cell division protein FtsN [[Haemophilus] felis]